MKKKILGIALIAMSFVAFNGMAQTPSNNNTVNQENVQGGKKMNKQARKAQVNPFEGLNLTESQQAQLQQLDSKRKAARQEQANLRKENKQRNDSTRMAERRSAKKAYLDEVKAIIGPDQYVVFLENMYVNAGGNQRHGDKTAFQQGKSKKEQGNRQGRGDRKGNRGGQHANNAKVKGANSVNSNS